MLEVVNALPGKAGQSIMALQKVVRGSAFWAPRETIWLKCLPYMKENMADWNSLVSKMKATKPDIGDVVSVLEVTTTFSNIHLPMLPGFCTDAKGALITLCRGVAKHFDFKNDDAAASTVDTCAKLCEKVLEIDPSACEFAAKGKELRKMLQRLGSVAIKRDVVQRAITYSAAMSEEQPLAALSKSLELAGGVDLTSHAEEIRAVCDSAATGFLNGEM